MREEKMRDKKMPETTDTVLCAGVGDLVAYLYGEANDKEARNFQNHLNDCATCSAELSAFGEVREGIVAWRDEALNPMAVRASDASTARDAVKSMSRRSALGALREFFTLSPLWLRGATAFASVLFVTLLFVTALHFFERPKTQVAQQTPSAPANANEKANGGPPGNGGAVQVPIVNTGPIDRVTPPVPKRNTSDDKVATRTKSNRRDKAPVLSNEERSQLSDLLIAEKEDEESVPRLYDLLSESNQ